MAQKSLPASLPAHLLADLSERRSGIEQLGVHVVHGRCESTVQQVAPDPVEPLRIEDDHLLDDPRVKPEAGTSDSWMADPPY